MSNQKKQVVDRLKEQIKANRHLIGVAAGSGLIAKYAEEGGADFLLALSSGYYRQKGVSSLAAYLPFANSNEVVMEFGSKDLLPRVKRIPVVFGLFASDPTINLKEYILQIKKRGFSGINNYPTIGLIDGVFRKNLEETGINFEKEVEAIRIANELGMFTVAFVFNLEQAFKMVDAGADVLCVHLGLTSGGRLGAKQISTLQSAKNLAIDIFRQCSQRNPNMIKMIYGGPVNKPIDLQFMYDGTSIEGYIGGSVFERIPAEQTVLQVTKSFKQTKEIIYENLVQKIIDGINTKDDYIDFIKKYISLHFNESITLNEIADIVHLSRSYLSTLFKNEVGISFSDYLIDFRLNRALEIINEKNLPLKTVANMVGYSNYAQFSKIFKNRIGKSPSEYVKIKQNHKSIKQ